MTLYSQCQQRVVLTNNYHVPYGFMLHGHQLPQLACFPNKGVYITS